MPYMKKLRNEFVRFLSPMKWNWWIVCRSILRELCLATIPLLHIYFVQQVVVALEVWNADYFWKILQVYIWVFVAYECARFLMRWWWWVEAVNAYRRVINKEYVQKFIQLDNTVATSVWTWKMQSILNKWIDTWCLQLNDFTRNIIKVFVTFIYAFVSIFLIQSWYAVLFFIVYIAVHILWVYINSFSLKYRMERYKAYTWYSARLVRIIMNKYEILQSGKTELEIEWLDFYIAEMDDANQKMKDPIHRFFALPEWFVSLSQFLVVIYIWSNIFLWTESLSTLVWLFWIFTLLWSAISNSMDFFREFTKQFTMIEYMRTFFDLKPTVLWYHTGNLYTHVAGNIVVDNLGFWYDQQWVNKNIIFSNISFDIQWWKKTALVWPSWWWKSTLIKLIAWYLSPDSWSIVVDDQKLESLSKKSRFAHIWYLTQEPNIFDGTFQENLIYWLSSNVSDADISDALRLSRCEFVYDLQEWVETIIWERWIRLSWWQRQRLAIAKIFLKKPRIILLDEPTSALDSESERDITEAMNNLFVWRTVIIIAHRLQTVKHADDIILIDSGTVGERWTHKELMKLWWKYFTMVELQSWF